MITLVDFNAQCITLQGNVSVFWFDEDFEKHVVFQGEGDSFEFDNIVLSEDFGTYPITHIWAHDGTLNIELEKEE